MEDWDILNFSTVMLYLIFCKAARKSSIMLHCSTSGEADGWFVPKKKSVMRFSLNHTMTGDYQLDMNSTQHAAWFSIGGNTASEPLSQSS